MARKRKSKESGKPDWVKGSRVIAHFEGEPYSGSVIRTKKRTAWVRFDDGDEIELPYEELEFETGDDSVDDDDYTPTKGHNNWCGPLVVAWTDMHGKRLSFTGKSKSRDDPFQARYCLIKDPNFEFSGEWWRTQERGSDAVVCCVSIIAKRGSHIFKVKDLAYRDRDPRIDMRSLNSDICAAIHQWLHDRGKHSTELDELVKRADNPEIVIDEQDLDRIILMIREFRDTLYHSGGERRLTLSGQNNAVPFGRAAPDTPLQKVTLVANFTTAAFANQGKAPPLGMGGALAQSGRTGKVDKTRVVKATPNPENVESLVSQLAKAKEAGDKSKCRAIRATLRKMGHKGGARSVKGK